jgi:hypothetical protein
VQTSKRQRRVLGEICFQAHPESNELKMIAAALLCPRLPSQAIESSMDSESHYFAVLAGTGRPVPTLRREHIANEEQIVYSA